MINGRTRLIAHLGYPTETFTAPMIYNPWFEKHAINAVAVPMGVMADDYPVFLNPCSGSAISTARWSQCRTRSRRLPCSTR
jgi:shikimate 5-dehydrogenase